jgi:glyoxylase-like metal-dependent hydrolase (beta-lactamase superfamily II)
VIIERSMNDDYLSNSYLVGDEKGGHGVLIDSGGPPEPLLQAIKDNDLTVEHLLLTHHHGDHVMNNGVFEKELGVELIAHPLEAELIDGDVRETKRGEVLEVGGLKIDFTHTPGHTAGMLAIKVNDEDVFTGDTLFKGSVGGVRAPGSTGFHDLKSSIMDKLMKLPPETRLHPGHTDPTTVGDEWENNAFIRVWRGEDEESEDRCVVWGEDATLVLWGPDYDGGHKAWVRWDSSGKDDIVPGSQVERK